MANVPTINNISRLRERAENQLDRIAYIEMATHLIPLGKRLQRHTHLLDRHDLFVAFENDPRSRHPGLYLLKRNHSTGARIWVCYNTIRIDAHGQSTWNSDVYTPAYRLFCRDLSIDLDVAEQAIVTILERDELIFGTGYLSGILTTDLNGALRALPDSHQPPPTLPSPVVELKSIEVKPVTPAALRPVALPCKPLQRR